MCRGVKITFEEDHHVATALLVGLAQPRARTRAHASACVRLAALPDADSRTRTQVIGVFAVVILGMVYMHVSSKTRRVHAARKIK